MTIAAPQTVNAEFLNTGFENGLEGWSTEGSVTIVDRNLMFTTPTLATKGELRYGYYEQSNAKVGRRYLLHCNYTSQRCTKCSCKWLPDPDPRNRSTQSWKNPARNVWSFVALRSTAQGGSVSRVVPKLRGGTVTDPRNDVHMVVTEHGCVNLKGLSIPQRARELINIADPEFRESLEHDAKTIGLL